MTARPTLSGHIKFQHSQVMLAIDHGYFQGPTTGLERIDLSILPLLPQCDALFCTRGVLRSMVPADSHKPMVLRASGGPSILREELSDEQIAMDMDDAVRLNAAGVGIQVFIGGEHETRSVHNMTKLVDAGLRVGMPVMGVTAVGKTMVRDAKYFRLACRIIAELGAQYVKTYYVDDGFETITASCPVPVVMAGGKKLPEIDALTMAYRAVQEGAAGVDPLIGHADLVRGPQDLLDVRGVGSAPDLDHVLVSLRAAPSSSVARPPP